MNVLEIGSIEALLTSVKTKVDGSCVISFEVNPTDIQVVNKLMQMYLIDKRLFTLGIVSNGDANG